MIYLELLLGFLQVGAFTFGGGYAAVPLIRDIVVRHSWLSEEELACMIAVSESTPGPIMVNMATYVGSSQGGFFGALIATIAVVAPSFLIILLVIALLKSVLKNTYVQAVLRGLKPCVIGIIFATGLCMIIENCAPAGKADAKAACITAILALILFGYERIRKKKMSPIPLIIISAFVGICVYGI
ncbi:MAG: chromate transporter [Oscillospiraceae bacterium]|nr:chromate transporter [Oscillospiraceae bacterium]